MQKNSVKKKGSFVGMWGCGGECVGVRENVGCEGECGGVRENVWVRENGWV